MPTVVLRTARCGNSDALECYSRVNAVYRVELCEVCGREIKKMCEEELHSLHRRREHDAQKSQLQG